MVLSESTFSILNDDEYYWVSLHYVKISYEVHIEYNFKILVLISNMIIEIHYVNNENFSIIQQTFVNSCCVLRHYAKHWIAVPSMWEDTAID